jgi:hypothetical protein
MKNLSSVLLRWNAIIAVTIFEIITNFRSLIVYPYFDVVVGLVWSNDPKSYAGGSVCYW